MKAAWATGLGRQTPIRGVNLGNWLVLERWMESRTTPGPFAEAKSDDEMGLRTELESSELQRRLEEHRTSYVTQADFDWLADVGCNFVRIPVPFFVFGDDEHESCVEHLDHALDWAAERGIAALVDLHTVPGGQNGFDNGGASGLCTWHQRHHRIDRTLGVLQRLAERYAGHPALWGLEAMNEPASKRIFTESMKRYGADHPERVDRSQPIPHVVLAQFYRLVFERVRPMLGPQVALVFHDQFQLLAWNHFMPSDRFPNVWIDTHQYVGTLARGVHARTLRAHVALAHAMGARIAMAQRHHPILVGEWSLTNNIKGLANREPQVRSEAYRSFARAQFRAWERGGGSCFWSLRNGRYGSWSLETAIAKGWVDLRG